MEHPSVRAEAKKPADAARSQGRQPKFTLSHRRLYLNGFVGHTNRS
jgi:hypothetical protein